MQICRLCFSAASSKGDRALPLARSKAGNHFSADGKIRRGGDKSISIKYPISTSLGDDVGHPPSKREFCGGRNAKRRGQTILLSKEMLPVYQEIISVSQEMVS